MQMRPSPSMFCSKEIANISIIEDFAFENCPTLGIVEFPNSLKKMGEIGEDSFNFFEKKRR